MNRTMKAWVLKKVTDLNFSNSPLEEVEMPVPLPGESEVLIKISCCGVCHTELDEVEGRVIPAFYPIVPGHQVVGTVVARGKNAKRFARGQRVGVSWIFSSCGTCEFCLRGLENLCNEFKGTGKDAHGGYAEYMTVRENFAFDLPAGISDTNAAPLFCAGAIGYRSLILTQLKNGDPLGFIGFGSSAHIVIKLAKHLYPDSNVVVFARTEEERNFAITLGASWAGEMHHPTPYQLQAIIDTTPVWGSIPNALAILKPGGRLVINAIAKEFIDKTALLDLDYGKHLWQEKEIKSVANITRRDVEEFLLLAISIPITPVTEIYRLSEANKVLSDLKHQRIRGSKVLVM